MNARQNFLRSTSCQCFSINSRKLILLRKEVGWYLPKNISKEEKKKNKHQRRLQKYWDIQKSLNLPMLWENNLPANHHVMHYFQQRTKLNQTYWVGNRTDFLKIDAAIVIYQKLQVFAELHWTRFHGLKSWHNNCIVHSIKHLIFNICNQTTTTPLKLTLYEFIVVKALSL